jgi:site-specific DNA-methyltransferase (adenine-specific)
MRKNKFFHQSEKQDWGTPQYIFDSLNKEFGFTVDVCASAENKKCNRFFSIEDDALKMDWSKEVCFMNPPYNRCDEFMEKAWTESKRGAIVVCLVPARLDASWWHRYAMKSEIRLFVQRLEFDGPKKNRAPFPSAVIVFRPPTFILSTIELRRSDFRKK